MGEMKSWSFVTKSHGGSGIRRFVIVACVYVCIYRLCCAIFDTLAQGKSFDCFNLIYSLMKKKLHDTNKIRTICRLTLDIANADT